MSNEQRFEIGEVAIFVKPGSPSYGAEVVVASPLFLASRVRDGLTDRFSQSVYVYRIEGFPLPPADTGITGWAARPEWLRKRPPKQDWKRLCKLDEVIHEEIVR